MPSYADPFRVGRHPFQRYLLALAVIGSVPLLFGEPTSGSVEASLPEPIVYGWGGILLFGSMIALLGVYWPLKEPITPRSFVTALFLERLGLALVWPTALVYAGIIVLVAGWAGVLSGAIVAGFGWAARRRMRDAGQVFKRAIAGDL
jgi:protein-S-isoprenylcysteine O-methyltransferase Ste14